MRTLSIAALQTASVAGDPDATADRLAGQISVARAIAPHVELILLPELHLSAPGQLEGAGYAEQVAVEIPGPLTERVGAIAREHGLWIVAGSVYERGAGGAIHNTAPVLCPDGELVAAYRKAFPWQPHEACVPGEELVTFEIPGLTGSASRSATTAASRRRSASSPSWAPRSSLHVSLTTTSDRAAELVMARANAIFNQLYVVSLNAAAPAGLGRSLIVDPEGIVRAPIGLGRGDDHRRPRPRRGHPRPRARPRRRLADVRPDPALWRRPSSLAPGWVILTALCDGEMTQGWV